MLYISTKYRYFSDVVTARLTLLVNFRSINMGFGFLNTEFYLGNDKLSYITNQKVYQLHIDAVFDGQIHRELFNVFRISDEKRNYTLVDFGIDNRRESMLK